MSKKLPKPWRALTKLIAKELIPYVVQESDSGYIWWFWLENEEEPEYTALCCGIAPRNLEQVGGPQDGSQGFDVLTYDIDAIWSKLQDMAHSPRNMEFTGGDEYTFNQAHVYLEGRYQEKTVRFYLLSCPESDEPDVLLHHGQEFEDLMTPPPTSEDDE